MRKRFVVVAAAFPLLAGCAASRTSLKSSFWDAKAPRIGVTVVQYAEPGAYKTGGQGLLDMAINNGMASSMNKYLSTLSVKAFDEEADMFVDGLKKRGMDVKKIAVDSLDLKTLDSKKRRNELLQQIASKENLDRLIVLSVRAAGTSRPYYGFIPLGVPKGYCRAEGWMFDLTHENDVLWKTNQTEESTLVAVESPWDEPPNYPHITAAFQQAVENGKKFLVSDFFGQDQAAK